MNNIPSVRFYSLKRDTEMERLSLNNEASAQDALKDLLSKKFDNIGKENIKIDLREPGNPLGIIEFKA